MVGARYIRDHEIAYIDQIKQAVTEGGLEWTRWEDTPQNQRGKHHFTIMDIQADVLKFYLAADVVVVPSLNEVLPLVICEAMAFKRPVVCTAIDAIPEAVADGVEGFLVPPADTAGLQRAMFKLYESPTLREQLGEAGRKRVESQFSYRIMCAQWRELMDRHLAEAVVPELLAGKTVLIDMDNTVVDWDGEFITRYAMAKSIDRSKVQDLVRDRKHFEIEMNFPEAERKTVLEVVGEPGFYAGLKPIPGAIEALREMVAEGVDVRLVTSPHLTCPASCASEKYEFILKYLGPDWIDRMVIARDKTYMYGDLLVDDKPKVTGSSKIIQWTHVIFDQPYNAHIESVPRLLGWREWKEALGRALKVMNTTRNETHK